MTRHDQPQSSEIASLTGSVDHVADDPHTRYRSTYLLDELFHDLVATLEPSLFVEAGAFEADTSLRVAQRVPTCRVVAFEANPYNYAHFTHRRDFAARGIDYRHAALAVEPGEATFNVMVTSSAREVDVVAGNNSLLQRTDGSYLGDVEYEHVTVPATTLDIEFCATDRLDDGCVAMWVDVEGASGMVLGGASRFLDRVDLIKIEVETVESWRGQWLADDVVGELASHGIVAVARDAQGRDQYNLVAVRRALVDRADVRHLLAQHAETSRRTLSRRQGRLRRSPALRRVARALTGR